MNSWEAMQSAELSGEYNGESSNTKSLWMCEEPYTTSLGNLPIFLGQAGVSHIERQARIQEGCRMWCLFLSLSESLSYLSPWHFKV